MISAQMDSRLCGNDDGESCASVGKYKMYPEYKDSGVEWLGDVPENWGSTQIKYGYQITLGKMLQKEAKNHDDVLKPYLKSVNIQPDGISVEKIEQMWFSPSDISSLRLKNGDVLISEGGDVGRSAIWKEELPECYIQNAINRARPFENNSSAFLHYWMHMLKSSDFIQIICNKATIAHYTAEKVESSPLFLPSDTEARSIANFLDHETAKIDTLIEEQQSLIRLLKEKRQAVISHAVTKGLNPDAPMKDSGVEWLGEGPEHWEVKRLKHVSEVVDCRNKTPEYFDDGEYFVVRTTNVKKQKLNFNGALYTDEKNFKIWTQRGIPPAGSILFTREAPAGEICLVPENLKFCLGQRMMNFISYEEEYKSFLFDFLLSDCLERYIESVSHGSTVTHLRVEQVQNIPVIVPPKEEADVIHQYLGRIKSKYHDLTQEAEQAIELMQERRTALISAAVTGKIDVRDWSPLKK
ncbi:MAG: restriction endonuclease subunit S [Kistimonas sp.]|nr:restriction endonuclease subunit S [Kistimonas sp.]